MARDAGFSLIELIVCMAIIAALAMLSVPFYHAFAAEQRLRGASFLLRADLNRAKSHARAANRQYRMVFHAMGYQLQRSDNSFSFVLDEDADDGGIELRRSFADTPGIRLKRASASPIFHPKGSVLVPSSIILHNNRNTERKITVSVAGRIKEGA